MALEDAGVEMESVDKKRFGCIVGTAFGGMETFEKQARSAEAQRSHSGRGPNTGPHIHMSTRPPVLAHLARPR
eukprot:4815595-Prymnesium_polylepis.1